MTQYLPKYLPKNNDLKSQNLNLPKIKTELLISINTGLLADVMRDAYKIEHGAYYDMAPFYDKLYEMIDCGCLLDVYCLLSSANYEIFCREDTSPILRKLNQTIMGALKCIGEIQYIRRTKKKTELKELNVANKIVDLNDYIDKIISKIEKDGRGNNKKYTKKKETKHILIVGNSPRSRNELKNLLPQKIYNFIEAQNSDEAVQAIDRHYDEIVLILIEFQISIGDCLELLAIMHTNGCSRDIPVVVVSTEEGTQPIPSMYEMDISAFINKPYDPENVSGQLTKLIRLGIDIRKEDTDIAYQMVKHDKNTDLMIGLLGGVIESQNNELGEHVPNVSKLTKLLLEEVNKEENLGFSQEYISIIGEAAALHDIGKICIPSEILNKSGKLTDEEFETMKRHTTEGYKLLDDLPYEDDELLIRKAKDIVRHHHEKWNGKGYPDGLSGNNIPIEAQVVGLADVYDALTAERCYKPAYPHKKAISMILEGECGAFNPELLDILKRNDKRVENIKIKDQGFRKQEDEKELILRTLERMNNARQLPEKRRSRIEGALKKRIHQAQR